MEKNNDWGQAFGIWYNDNPVLSFEDIQAVCGLDSHREVAKKIFYSDRHEFTRWAIKSGFQEFLESRNDEPDIDWEGEPVDGPTDRTMSEAVIRDLWAWMRYNEKTIS